MSILSHWKNYRNFRKLTPPQRTIVFYSESGQDWHHFEPVIRELTKHFTQTVCYISSDEEDPGLRQDDAAILAFHIPTGTLRILLFQSLRARVMILTMMDLDNFELKRSLHPVHYIYMFHGMGSTHMVDFENSYDHYDSIFCAGPHQMSEIRRREALKGLPAKNLVAVGYPRLEALLAHRREPAPRDGRRATLLLAPTWGPASILNQCGRDLLSLLLDAGYRVVLRPHYHTRIVNPNLVGGLIAQFQAHPNFSLVESMGETASLFESDLMISDWSAAAIEYALGLEKPVLFIDVPRRIRNPNYEELGIEPIEAFIRDQVGGILPPSNLREAPRFIERLLSSPERFRERIGAIRRERVYNLGRSAQVAAREIVKISGAGARG